jgi:hypothetical protein
MPKGGAELMAFLDSLPAKIEQNLVRGALRAGAKVSLEEVKRQAGNLHTPEIKGSRGTTPPERIADKVYVTARTLGGVPRATIKLKGFPAAVAIWAEYGTLAHWISVDAADRTTGKGVVSIKTTNKNAREGGSLVIGKNFVGPSVFHPGAAAHPFFRPAIDQTAQAALEAAAAHIRAKIESGGLNTPDSDDEDDEE